MVDRLGYIVRKGNCVKYWHRVNGISVPEIGEVVCIIKHWTSNSNKDTVKIERKFYNNNSFSFRTSTGITRMSKSEAVLWKMEQFTVIGMD